MLHVDFENWEFLKNFKPGFFSDGVANHIRLGLVDEERSSFKAHFEPSNYS